MWRLKGSIGARHLTWLDGLEPARSVFSGWHSSEAKERWIGGIASRVFRMVVLTLGIGLPYFDHRVR
jgi:hypothetical protein